MNFDKLQELTVAIFGSNAEINIRKTYIGNETGFSSHIVSEYGTWVNGSIFYCFTEEEILKEIECFLIKQLKNPKILCEINSDIRECNIELKKLNWRKEILTKYTMLL